ncbi:MAG TPA: fused MFS/spermidine synthase [Bryobacteraceae bacterium]|nr:fused MFS/spermidine synthase [Bryobacteraceae bacterium]
MVDKLARVSFGATIFLSAFLLFQIQPMIARLILPRMGGGAAVWTTCMLFFQIALLVGYAYAHWVAGRLSRIHLLVLGSLALLPLRTNFSRLQTEDPVRSILVFLAISVGVPCLALASTAPLMQRWFSLRWPDASPYRLYALSNAGSLIALLSYPILVEPYVTLRTQVTIWSAFYATFVIGTAWLAWSQPAAATTPEVTETRESIGMLRPLYWTALAAVGSALLLATTNQMCQEIAVIPFLWILPLSIYLLTFILCFESTRWYRRATFAVLSGILVLVECALIAAGAQAKVWLQIVVGSLALFALCMVCHGELGLARPAAWRLTTFYLSVAAGGAIGGIFTAIVAPKIFTTYAEYPVALTAACVLAIIGWIRTGAWREWRANQVRVRVALAALLFGAITPVIVLRSLDTPGIIGRWRNFYGVLRLEPGTDQIGDRIVLTHGTITHGFQYRHVDQRRWPTSYYGPDTAAGLVFEQTQKSNRRVGFVGLGAGTLSAYGKPGDAFRFYELNPQVVQIAVGWFRYLTDSRATNAIVLGDARVELERELAKNDPQRFDLLFVDAFSSDAIPLHLLTAECADVYRRHLAADGVLLFHVTNRWVNLRPVTRGIAAHLGWEAAWIPSEADPTKGESYASWVVLTSNHEFLARPTVRSRIQPWLPHDSPFTWTDDFASLWRVLRF